MTNPVNRTEATVTDGLGAMSPFETSAANPLVLLGNCPIEDLIGYTTVSLG